MKRVFQLRPGIAAYLGVKELTNPGVTGPHEHAAIFMSHEKGVVVGMRETPLADWEWPKQVKDAVNEHFRKVFALRHEDWTPSYLHEPSPRAAYLDSLQPWLVEVDE